MNAYQCTLYGVKSLNKLQQFLQIKAKQEFKALSSSVKSTPLKYYSPFKDENKRELFNCSSHITFLHKKVMRLFNLEQSTYLKSGVKKESHITNAKEHQNSNFFLLIDIKGFYPSITKSKIKTQLIQTYKQSKDVAEFLSNLLTVPQEKSLGKRALVTGSPLSQWFAYVINKKMFDELYNVSKEENIIFSVYVDDITFSSKSIISYKFYTKIYNIINKYEYRIHQGKMYRGKLCNKTKVTGIQFTKYGFRLLDKHKEKIRKIVKSKDCSNQIKSLLGLVNFAIQVNPRYSKYKYLIEKSLLLKHSNTKNKNQYHKSPTNSKALKYS
ncbi:MAG: Unknown protein [uncultured Sulfurovum sp.]|uniref:Uncharacterized protein n=1 Tax=uncultured Sulfurovum sp. TaxID=269237 RepID=A0A6S6TU31_9BACT|nr:MAG: Unknown protein [uncultured Sulfurovum sp.]